MTRVWLHTFTVLATVLLLAVAPVAPTWTSGGTGGPGDGTVAAAPTPAADAIAVTQERVTYQHPKGTSQTLWTLRITNRGEEAIDPSTLWLGVDGNTSLYGTERTGRSFNPWYAGPESVGESFDPGESFTVIGTGPGRQRVANCGDDLNLWRDDFSRIQVAQGCAFLTPLQRGDTLSVRRGGPEGQELARHTVFPALEVEQPTLGNVFSSDDDVHFDVASRGDTVRWHVVDYWGDTVAAGESTVGDDRSVRLDPAVDTPGHYRIYVRATTAGREIGRTNRSLAVLRPHDFTQYEESYFVMQTHFSHGWNTSMMPLIRRMGAKHIRDGQIWNRIQPDGEGYTYPQQYRDYVSTALANDIRPLTIYAYGNREIFPEWHGRHTAPWTSSLRDAYTRYATTVLTEAPYADSLHYAELWNEPNARTFSKGPSGADPEDYATLVNRVGPAIGTARSDVTRIGGAVAWTTKSGPGRNMTTFEWMNATFEAGALENVDAWSVHPYRRQSPPEATATSKYSRGSLRRVLERVQTMMAQHGDAPEKPLWVTEWGHLTGGPKSVGQRGQAQYLVRGYLMGRAAGVEKFAWYRFMDTGAGPYGIIHDGQDPRGRYAPKQAYPAYATMARELTGATIESTTTDRGVYDYRFERDGETTRVLWAPSRAQVALETDGPITATDVMGERRTYQPHDGQVHLTLSGDPLYVRGPIQSVQREALVTLDAESAATGENVSATLALDNRDGESSREVTVALADQRWRLSAAPGERATRDLSLPAVSRPGTRVFRGDVRIDGQRVGSVRASVDVRPALTLALEPTVDGQRSVQARLESQTDRTTYTLSSVSWRVGDGQRQTRSLDTSVESGDTVETTLPVGAVPHYSSRTVDVTIDVEGRQPVTATTAVSFNPIPKRSITVDGELEATDAPAISLTEDGANHVSGYDGPSDLSGDVWLSWDDDNLYFSANLTDDVHAKGWPLWQYDSVQLGVAPGRPGSQETFSEITFALSPNGPTAFRAIQPPHGSSTFDAAEVAVSRNNATNTTVYELAVPWSAINASPDEPASVSLLVNDNDRSGREGWIEWGGGIGSGKNPANFRPATFVGLMPTPRASTPTGGDGDGSPDDGSGETPAEPDSPTETSAPGFGAIALLASLLIAVTLLARRRR